MGSQFAKRSLESTPATISCSCIMLREFAPEKVARQASLTDVVLAEHGNSALTDLHLGRLFMRVLSHALVLVPLLALASIASSTPTPNSAVLHTRVFDDCPTSVLSVTNLFPATGTVSA